MNSMFQDPGRQDQQPAINVPSVVLALGGAMVVIHVLRSLVFSAEMDLEILFLFAFWPLRYAEGLFASGDAPGGFAADLWSFVTYGFLHGGISHLVFNLLWMAIFGSALARRFGVTRFLLISALCAAAGALAHLATNFGSASPMIGASAAVSGHMAASLRFIFELGGPLGAFSRADPRAYRVPAVPLRETMKNRQVMVFMAIWFGLNFFFGIGSESITGGAAAVAWQAHIGGFVAGLLLFPLFDPIERPRPPKGPDLRIVN